MNGYPDRQSAQTPEVITEAIHEATRANGCPMAVTRDGEMEPCEKPSTTIVTYQWDDRWWTSGMCTYHAHMSAGHPIPLSSVIHLSENADTVEATRKEER